MLFTGSKKGERSPGIIYLTALAFSAGFMFFGIAFILYAGKLSKQETVEYIQQATQQTKFAIDEHIREEFITLFSIRSFVETFEPWTLDTLPAILSEIVSLHHTFVSVGIADSSGHAILAERDGTWRKSDLSEEAFIKQALSGRQAVTEGRWDEANVLRVNYYAVPIYQEGMVKGVLFAADPENEMRTIVNHSLHAGKGLAHIIMSDGGYVLRSQNPERLANATSVFGVRPPLDEGEKRRMLQDMAEGKAGYMEKDVYGESRLVAYAPLKENGWYVFYAVPENKVNSGLKAVKDGAIGIIGIAAAVFIAFIFLIRSSNNENRKKLERLAFEDPLTGQRNFQKFLMDANAALLRKKPGKCYSLWYYNIKDFKYINDMFGPKVGDCLLLFWAGVLAGNTRPEEVFGRVSADIFVALRTHVDKEDIVQRFAEEVKQFRACPAIAPLHADEKDAAERFAGKAERLDACLAPVSCGYRATMYLGVYLISGEDGDCSVIDMLDKANVAYKSIKRGGGSQFRFYSKEMREQKLWETEMEARFETALANREFEVYLQPKVDIQNGYRVMGMEALVRWISPEKGLIAPDRFIPLFEKNGMIVPLDRYVFETACKNYRENLLTGRHSPFVMSVNVSRLALLQPDFIESYVGIKNKYEIPDRLIELEFTESLVFENHELFQATVAKCQSHGFLCSLDDFGTGYSSLHILTSLKVDVLKLDRQFFQCGEDNGRGQKLVKSVVAMANALDMKTIAEGISEEQQVDLLREAGCDAIQGYVFAKPMPMEDFKRFVETWPETRESNLAASGV